VTIKFFEHQATPVDVLTAGPDYIYSLNSVKGSSFAVATFYGIQPGVYDILIVSPHCLANVKRNVTLSGSNVVIDMGTLLEGDANDDGGIRISDFGLLAMAYGKVAGQAGFDARADFDRDGQVRIADFGLLSVNYFKYAPIEIPQSPPEPRRLSFSFPDSLNSSISQDGHLPWVQDVKIATQGRISIETYPGESLVRAADTWEAVKAGVVDIAQINIDYYGQFDLCKSINLPFLAPTSKTGSQTAWALYQEYPEIRAQMLPDVKVLTAWITEPGYFIAKKSIAVMEDLKGLKIATYGQNSARLLANLGAVPVIIFRGDLYPALLTGVIDGALIDSNTLLGYKLYEVASYITYTQTTSTYNFLAMNMNIWNSLSSDMQQAIMSVSGEYQAARYGRDVFDRARGLVPGYIAASGGHEYVLPLTERNRWKDIAGLVVWNEWVTSMQNRGYNNASAILNRTIDYINYYTAQNP
jgi:TRAP-type C4-dicarboxylate transport system substrate-binding protein